MSAGRRLPFAHLLLLGMLSLPACVVYTRFQKEDPILQGTLAQLQPGEDLAACLLLLGAPHHAFEYRGDGMALLWIWGDTGDWSVDLHVPLQENLSASFELDLTDAMLPGCMLWFDADLRLEHWRTGTIGELLPRRVRPSAVEPGG